MRGRVLVGKRAVAGARDHRAVAHDDAADRHLAARLRGAGFLERELHVRGQCHKACSCPKKPPHDKQGERIAKVMARAGLASRREAEAWIAAGRVAVNGAVIASPALNVTAADRIAVDGQPLPRARAHAAVPLSQAARAGDHHIPTRRGGRPSSRALPKDLPRLISVGRLDINTEGLLLLTNDGGLARVLELPATGWLRRYRVRAFGRVHAGGARRAARRHHGRRRALRADRGDARPRTGRQCLAHLRHPRGQEPRGAQGAGDARAAGEPADPRRRSGRSSWASSTTARWRKCRREALRAAARRGDRQARRTRISTRR